MEEQIIPTSSTDSRVTRVIKEHGCHKTVIVIANYNYNIMLIYFQSLALTSYLDNAYPCSLNNKPVTYSFDSDIHSHHHANNKYF